MIEYTLIHDAISLANYISIEALADFIHYQSIPYEDTKQAIIKAIEYSFSKDVGKGGFIIVAMDNREVIGASVVNYSGMDLYIPNVFLVYIAVSEDHRGQGIGSSIIRKIIENCKVVFPEIFFRNTPSQRDTREESESFPFGEYIRTIISPYKLGKIFLHEAVIDTTEIIQSCTYACRSGIILLAVTPCKKLINSC